VWNYRKYARWRLALVPLVVSLLTTLAGVWIAARVNAGILKPFLGVFFIALAAYFMVFSKRIHVRANLPTAVGGSAFAGLTGGIFSINGPPMVLYFLSVTRSIQEYMGTLQFFFLFNSAYTVAARWAAGLMRASLLPYAAGGCAAMAVGLFIGGKIAGRINGEMVKRVVYIVIAGAGVSITLGSLL
jgi:uncharacterized membrane protein YfcA